MLRHPVDPVKANAAAYLQHLCFENEGVKRRVRQLRGLPLLVALLDHPRAEVRRRACGALRNLSYGRDTDNKAAIRDCGGVPALVRLLRAARDNEVRELVTGTLWNLSSYEPLKMVIIDHGLQTLTHEVIVPHSGWEREPNEDSKPRDAEWTTVFKNTSGCLRNVSSDGAEARRRLRECEGLVDALLHALQSAVGRKDTDNKSVENCVCIMRNLSYHVHKEVPGADRYQEAEPGPPGGAAGSQRRRRDDAGCFGGKKAKEEWFHQGKKDGEMDRNFDTLDLPKRTEAAKGEWAEAEFIPGPRRWPSFVLPSRRGGPWGAKGETAHRCGAPQKAVQSLGTCCGFRIRASCMGHSRQGRRQRHREARHLQGHTACRRLEGIE